MPTYYENTILGCKIAVSEQDYANAWLVYQSRFGRLKGKNTKTVLCMVLAVLSGCYIPSYLEQYDTFWIPVVVVLAALAGAVYFQILLPQKVIEHGRELFRSSKFLSLPSQLLLYRDSYCEENAYEKIVGHWTDHLGCSETGSLFVVMGGWDRELLVIPKRDLTSDEIQKVSEHFQNTFVEKYRLYKR